MNSPSLNLKIWLFSEVQLLVESHSNRGSTDSNSSEKDNKPKFDREGLDPNEGEVGVSMVNIGSKSTPST